MDYHLSRAVAPVLAVALLAGTALPVLAQQQIGVTAAVNPAAEGRPPIAQPRELRVGVNVVANERIVTTDKGQAQMLFLDESAFSIGPNSDVVLDEFVYDPNAGTGKIALSATKGVFRVVGGKISKNTPVELKTPTATIGIRGGIALVDVQPGGQTQATFLFGAQMTVTTPGGGTQVVQRPGFVVTATSANAPPSAPVQATTQQLTGTVSSLEGAAPPAGPAAPGGGQTPNDNQVQQTQLSQQNSGNAPQNVAPGGPGPNQPPPPGPPPQASQTTTQAQQNQTQDSSTLGSGLTLTSTFLGNIVRAVVPTGSVGSSVKFGLGNNGDIVDNTDVFEFSGKPTNGTFNASFTETTGSFTFPIQTGSAFSTTISSSPFGALSGTGFLAPDKDFFIYDLAPSSGSSKHLLFGGVATPDSAFPTSGATYYRFVRDTILGSDLPFIPSADGGAIFPDKLLSLSELSSALTSTSDNSDAAIYWDKSGSASANRVFFALVGGTSGTGSAQSSGVSVFVGRIEEDVTGEHIVQAKFRGGVKRATDTQFRIFSGDAESVLARESSSGVESDFFGSDKPKYFGLVGADNSDVTSNNRQQVIEFFQGSSQQYVPGNFLVPGNETIGSRTNHTPSGTGYNQTMRGYATAISQFITTSGSLSSSRAFTSSESSPTLDNVLVKTSAASNKVKASFVVMSNTSDIISANFGDNDAAFGDTSPTSGRSAFIEDGYYGAVESSTSPTLFNGQNMGQAYTYMFVTDSGDDLPTANYCDCQFTQWGFWGGQIQRGTTGFERLHAGLWVAGVPSLLTSISGLTGTATYNGHVIGAVQNGSSTYLAAGNLAVTVNFGSPSASTVSITNFDGGTFTSSGGLSFTTAGSGRNAFTGTLAGSGGQAGRSGSLAGSFFQNSSGTDPAAEMGGQFKAAGSGYSTAGIFAGKK